MDYKQFATEVMDFEPSSTSAGDVAFMVRVINSRSAPKISSYFRFRGQSTVFKKDQITASRLQEMGLIQGSEGKFLSGSTSYRLTEKGIFHVLSKLEEYPPALLIRYSDSNVLETLIYQFFEVQTIKRSTATLYAEVNRYLKECSVRTILRLESFRNSKSEHQLSERVTELASDLTWMAKLLVLKLAMMYSEANILRSTSAMTKDNAKVALYELENDMKGLLVKDNKFKNFLKLAYDELEEGYGEFRKRSEQL